MDQVLKSSPCLAGGVQYLHNGISLFAIGNRSIQAHIQKSSLRLKKMTRMLWWLVVAGIVIGIIDFFENNGQIQRFSLIMIPFSFFLTFSFSHKTLGIVAIGLFYITLTYSVLKFFLHF